MEKKLVRKILQVDGMTCVSCENRIKNYLEKLDGVIAVTAIYSSSNVYINYDANVIKLKSIIEALENMDYTVKNKPEVNGIKSAATENNYETTNKMGFGQIAGIIIIFLALYVIIKNTVGFNFIPEVDPNMSYGILFFIGLLTSLHCIAMCGGINLSVCVSFNKAGTNTAKYGKIQPTFLYNTGRVVSYTIVGGIVGGLGSLVSFSGTAKGIVAILTGLFMVIMGLNMLNVFPNLKRLSPHMPKILSKKLNKSIGNRGPFFVGLINGLMPCGPLQAIQLYALGTGSILGGALSMLLFSLGTVPLMFGFGAVSSFLSGKFTHRMMKVSAALVLILGLVMLNRGIMLSGINSNVVLGAVNAENAGIAKLDGNYQKVTTVITNGRYAPIIIQKGIPVKWTISASAGELNGCNNAINVPEFGIENKKLEAGDTIIEFTPDKTGNYIYTCWMGMISSNIQVVDDINKVDTIKSENKVDNDTPSLGSSGGCCGG